MTLLLGSILACTEEIDAPPGYVVAGSGDAAKRLAACLATFPASPAARWSSDLAFRVGSCPTFRAVSDSLATLPAAAACGDPLDGDLVLVTPDRSVATLSFTDRVSFHAEIRDVPPLLRPGGDPGPTLLRADDSIVHARMAVDGGIDLSAASGQGDEMFRLGLFSAAVLDGTWELALYAGAPVPRSAVAIGIRSADAANAAMTAYVADIRKNWDVEVVAARIAGADGACLPGLQLLPGLAPCYVATDRALVIGWDRASVEHALGPGTRPLLDGLVVDGVRMAEADGGHYPWGRIELTGQMKGGKLVIEGTSGGSCP